MGAVVVGVPHSVERRFLLPGDPGPGCLTLRSRFVALRSPGVPCRPARYRQRGGPMTLANRYVLDGAVAGELDTTSFTGQPMMALSVDGEAVDGATLSSTSFGHEVTAALPGSPDRTT